MARGGAKPKPVHLRLVDGTHNVTRHGDRAKAREQVERNAQAFGKIGKPSRLLGAHAKEAWKKWIEPANWLDASREAAAIAFCNLWHEMQEAPRQFPAAKYGQWRALMSELGLTDERNRGEAQEDKDEFLDA